MYMPTLARFTSRDPLPPDGEALLLGHASVYAYSGSNPINRIDPSGKQAVKPNVANNCTPDDLKCITSAIQIAIDTLKRIPECFARIQCADGNRSGCGESLTDCILTVLGRITISCADRGPNGCHKGGKNPAQTVTPCGVWKGLASLGVFPTLPLPGLPNVPVAICNPCQSPFAFLNDCSACPADPGATIFLCTDQAPDKKNISSYCKDKINTQKLAALLVHEASHACVGGHETTGGNIGGKPTCDKCRRPDSTSIETEFKRCMTAQA